ncbi:unnamed protein product [Arabidopsis halleri]
MSTSHEGSEPDEKKVQNWCKVTKTPKCKIGVNS